MAYSKREWFNPVLLRAFSLQSQTPPGSAKGSFCHCLLGTETWNVVFTKYFTASGLDVIVSLFLVLSPSVSLSLALYILTHTHAYMNEYMTHTHRHTYMCVCVIFKNCMCACVNVYIIPVHLCTSFRPFHAPFTFCCKSPRAVECGRNRGGARLLSGRSGRKRLWAEGAERGETSAKKKKKSSGL